MKSDNWITGLALYYSWRVLDRMATQLNSFLLQGRWDSDWFTLAASFGDALFSLSETQAINCWGRESTLNFQSNSREELVTWIFSIRKKQSAYVWNEKVTSIRDETCNNFETMLIWFSLSTEQSFFFLQIPDCEAIGIAATPGLLCQPRVIVKMIMEKQMECRLAGETKVLG
jgi:hypothetical protein